MNTNHGDERNMYMLVGWFVSALLEKQPQWMENDFFGGGGGVTRVE